MSTCAKNNKKEIFAVDGASVEYGTISLLQ